MHRSIHVFVALVVGCLGLLPAPPLPAQTERRAATPEAKNPGAEGQESASSRSSPDLWENKVLVTVNRDVITEAAVWKELRGVVEEMTPENRILTRNAKILDMVEKLVYDQAAQRLKLQLDKKSLTEWIESQKEQLGGEQEWRQMILESGVSEEKYVSDVAQGAKRSLYLRAQAGGVKSLGPGLRSEHVIDPTASQIRVYYQKHKEQEFSEPAGAKVRAMAILHSRHEGKEGALAKAREIKRDLETGADFAVLAKKYSPLMQETNGDLGWIDKGASYNELIVDHAFKGEKGKVSEPLEYARGYWLVWVEDRREARIVPFSEAQKAIREKIREQNLKKALDAVRLKVLTEAWIQPEEFKTLLLRRYTLPPR